MPVQDKLKEIVDKYPNVELDQACWSGIGAGWLPLFEELVKEVSAVPGPPVEFEQVKEKFGELRIHSRVVGVPFDSEQNREHQKLVHKYERKSRTICEDCGSPGEIRDYFSDGTERHWVRCLCDTCNQPKKKV